MDDTTELTRAHEAQPMKKRRGLARKKVLFRRKWQESEHKKQRRNWDAPSPAHTEYEMRTKLPFYGKEAREVERPFSGGRKDTPAERDWHKESEHKKLRHDWDTPSPAHTEHETRAKPPFYGKEEREVRPGFSDGRRSARATRDWHKESEHKKQRRDWDAPSPAHTERETRAKPPFYGKEERGVHPGFSDGRRSAPAERDWHKESEHKKQRRDWDAPSLAAWEQNKDLMDASASSKEEPKDMRLNKAIALSGECSRRAADDLIFAGKVWVNGTKETNPARRVLPTDHIHVSGKLLLRPEEKKTYLMLNKPIQVVSTAHDPDGRKTVLDFLPDAYKATRLYPVGRLDYFSEGLILLTNDGDLAYALMHPKFHLSKVYRVRIRGFVERDMLQKMQEGMSLSDGTQLLPIEVHAHTDENDTVLLMTLHQGVNRQIRKICEDLNLTILKLERIAEGPLQLGNLPSGQIRPLTSDEVASLYASVARQSKFGAFTRQQNVKKQRKMKGKKRRG